MITAVFDTNFYFQSAIGKRGPAAECWRLVATGLIRVYITEQILNEIQQVLTRPELSRKFPILTFERAEELLTNYRTNSQLVSEVSQIFELERDRDDELLSIWL